MTVWSAWPPLSALGAEHAAAFTARVDPSSLRSFVEALPGPRSSVHAPEALAAAEQLILERFRAAGWSAEIRRFEVGRAHGRLDYHPYTKTVFRGLRGSNVVAEKEGDEPDDVVVAVAHHDTVRDSPGANDNGSSIAVLLAAARLLSPCRLRRTIVLATTDMEEIGLFGARAFLADISERRRVHGAITLETIGYLSPEPGSQHIPPGFEIIYRRQSRLIRERQSRGDFVAVIYNRNASTLAHRYAAALAAATSDHVPVLLRAPAGLARGRVDAHLPFVKQLFRGDHAVFWAAGVPALQVTDTADLRYPHYHEPTDTPDRLDYDHLARLAVATAVTLAEAAT